MRSRVFAATVLIAAAAIAQEPESPPPPNAAAGNGAFGNPSAGLFGGAAGAYVGLAVTNIEGEGSYAATMINTEFSLGPVGLGLSVPLNVMIWNNDQCCVGGFTRESKTYGGLIRKRDWDEPQDFARFIRFIRYGNKRDPVYAVAGQLWAASIGHGTLVSRYSNSLSLDHP